MTTDLQSPLKRVNPEELKPKYETDLLTIFSKDVLPNQTAFFHDFYCLSPKCNALETQLQSLDNEQVLALPNLNGYFRVGTNILLTADRLDTKRWNVLHTLIPFTRNILSRKLDNYTVDVMTLLCGSLDKGESVMSDFVTATDAILRDSETDTQFKSSLLRLVIIMTCLIGQNSPNSYFLKRDFFPTLTKMLSDPAVNDPEQVLIFLGNLANFRKFEGRNLYLQRLEDLAAEDIMRSILDTVLKAVDRCQSEYIRIADDGPPSFTTTLTSLFASFNITNYLKGALKTQHASSPISNGTENVYLSQPLPDACLVFFTFYDLMNVNKVFLHLLLDAHSLDFMSSFISYVSYTLCHASSSPRSKAFAKLHLMLLTLLVEDEAISTKYLTSDDSLCTVRLCRQRNPPLPYRTTPRPLMCAILDCCLIFLRHNLARKLEVESYLLTVQLLHKIMHGLKTERIRLDYEWSAVWTALMSLASIIIAKYDHIREIPKSDDLISELLVVFDFAAFWSDVLFSTAEDFSLFFYELLRNESIIDKLSELTNVYAHHEKPKARLGPAGRASDSCRNLKAIVAHFSSRIDDFKENNRADREPEVEDVLAIVNLNSEKLDLMESLALEDIRPFAESQYENTFKKLYQYATSDAIAMLDAKG